MPIAIENLGWKLYMINGAWDFLLILGVWYWWVETKGKTLEEIDEKIEGKHYLRTEIGVAELQKGGDLRGKDGKDGGILSKD